MCGWASCYNHTKMPAWLKLFLKIQYSIMASKKQSAKPATAEKTTKTATTPAPVAPVKAAKTAAPAAKKTAATAVAAKAPVKNTASPKKSTTTAVSTAVKTTKVTFTLPKEAVENAETVAVLGDFNNWKDGLALSKQKDGSFKAAVELEKGRSYEYRFLINGEKWENDWAAEQYAPTPFGNYNSVVKA